MLIYFYNGTLPWQGLGGRHTRDHEYQVLNKKMEVSIEELCKGLPEEFATYLTYVRKLEFTETPNYVYIRKLFRDLYMKLGYKDDNIFDWSKN